MQNPTSNSLKSICLCTVLTTLVACQSRPAHEIESAVSTDPVISNPAGITQIIPPPQIEPANIKPEPPIDNLWGKIRSGLELQEHYFHADVSEQLQNYINNQAYFDLTVERARPFLNFIVTELEARELPLELALLPFVESGFNPNASSGEYAVGLWQFMGATAASFGLQRDWWYDARRDPHASTIAALDYLQELLQQFDQDWLLALAAYNAGDGNVRRAIRRSAAVPGESPFWDLALPRETRLHVPRVLALARLVSDSGNYGITLAPISVEEPLSRVQVGAQIDLAQAARLANIDYAELREINPGYLQWATHPDQPQSLLLPHAEAEVLEVALAGLSPDQFLTWDHYQIQPGDTLAAIAKRYNTRVDVLQRTNNLRGSQIIAGRSLLIPRNPDTDSIAVPLLANGPLPTSIPSSYRIRTGDNLWSIARRFNLRSADIAFWNGLDLNAILRPGQIINLDPDGIADASTQQPNSVSAATYTVRRGDSMASIAARFDTDLLDLLEQNNLDAAAVIFPGQIIRIQQ